MIDKSEQINELAAALAKAQAAIQPASKEAENLGFKNAKTGKASKYADLAAVWEACRGPLSANNLSVVQLPTDAEAGRVGLTSILMHSSGQYISRTVSMRLVQDTPHGMGSALTYLRRYTLAALVGVVADEDDDGNAASGHMLKEASYSKPPAQTANGKILRSPINPDPAIDNAIYEEQAMSDVRPGNGRGGKASDKQKKMLFAIWNKGNFDGKLTDWIGSTFGCGVDDLSVAQASEAIGMLQPPE